MYRVAVPVLLSFALTACALGSSNLTSGLAENPTSQPKAIASSAKSGSLGGEPLSRPIPNQRTAKLDDRKATSDQAPKGSFEKAPAGALSDRNFGDTKLDVDRARDLINGYRQSKGLKPLKLNTSLTEAAKNHSRDLAKWDRISHYGSDGSNPWDRVKRTGYNAKLAAENVGTGQVSIDEVMKGWQESAGHNKNLLLADAEHMGIALVQDPKTEFKTFWTLVVGSSL
jgi:uncharacterized protein YkwD